MINRIVKMTFKESEVEHFKSLFDNVQEKIREFEGCVSLKLLQDSSDARIFFTYSCWLNDNSLQQYRNSELFKQTWTKTKAMFDERAQAWSTNLISNS